jgi:integral membrane protein
VVIEVPPPTAVRALVPVAVLEAVSLVVLLGFAAARAAGGPDLSSLLGPLHGIVFVLYVVTVIQAREHMGWSAGRTAVVILAAVVPVGGAVVAHHVARRPQ